MYSLLGAVFFWWVEREYEQELIKQEKLFLDHLRNDTISRLKRLLLKSIFYRKILLWYESQLIKLKMTKGLEWDMWGALFYVGTILTTIGYGNIAPRTSGGRALSIVYAIFGIPLVLAILSEFGRMFTTFVSNQRIAETRKRQKLWDKRRRNYVRTIPIWLALFICIGWICICAGLFCLWETHWSYFTSLYFFFISLSTIGLGDVVPDHPHMLILMFWLVIIGLSIVSMLISVIQIKFEEWLYHLMIRMQVSFL
ncbi:unnamed protein product [Thelazia callipaeda]|uniref:Ion channel n=1 Tax=Thelazia callipaeda TaxID=103827 RepID=A0A0N5CS55_THECL|nr:unnamed protein product [Thelazia callipaeda]